MGLPTIAVTPGSGTTINTLQNGGQNTSANSHPVVIASDQSAVPANITQVGGTNISVSNSGLPVDAAGTKVTAATIPTGGVGFLGWLSAIWYQLTQLLTFNLSQIGGTAVGASNGLPIYDGYAAPATATWTTATTANTAQAVNTSGYDTVVVTSLANASVTGGVLTFEVYDGVNWLPIKGARPDSYLTDSTHTLSASDTRSWQFSVAGFTQFRTRLSSVVTGTAGSVGLTAIVSSAPDVSCVTVGLDPNQALPAGTNAIGGVSVVGQTTGGATPYSLVAAASTNATSVKASAGTVKSIQVFNNGATPVYLKFYDTATAPTAGSGTPVKRIMIPGTSGSTGSGAAIALGPEGVKFANGIGFTCTGGIADTDTTALTAGTVLINFDYF